MSVLAETQTKLLTAVAESESRVHAWQSTLAFDRARLEGFEMAVAAMPAPERRNLKAEIAAVLSDAPQSVEAIRDTIGGRIRDIDRTLRRMPLQARKTDFGWVRVTEPELREAAE